MLPTKHFQSLSNLLWKKKSKPKISSTKQPSCYHGQVEWQPSDREQSRAQKEDPSDSLEVLRMWFSVPMAHPMPLIRWFLKDPHHPPTKWLTNSLKLPNLGLLNHFSTTPTLKKDQQNGQNDPISSPHHLGRSPSIRQPGHERHQENGRDTGGDPSGQENRMLGAHLLKQNTWKTNLWGVRRVGLGGWLFLLKIFLIGSVGVSRFFLGSPKSI